MEPPPLQSKKQKLLIISGALVLLLSLGVGLGVGLGNSKPSSTSPTNTNTQNNNNGDDGQLSNNGGDEQNSNNGGYDEDPGTTIEVENGYSMETLSSIQESTKLLNSQLNTNVYNIDSNNLIDTIKAEKVKLDTLVQTTIATGGFTNDVAMANLGRVNKRFENELIIKYIEILDKQTQKSLDVLKDSESVTDIEALKTSLSTINTIKHGFDHPLLKEIQDNITNNVLEKITTYVSSRAIITPIREVLGHLRGTLNVIKGNSLILDKSIIPQYNDIDLTTIPKDFVETSQDTNNLIKSYYEIGYDITTELLTDLTDYFSENITALEESFQTTDRDSIWLVQTDARLRIFREATKNEFFKSTETIELYKKVKESLYTYEVKFAEYYNSEYTENKNSESKIGGLVTELEIFTTKLSNEKTEGTAAHYLNHLNEVAKALVKDYEVIDQGETGSDSELNVAMVALKSAIEGVSSTIVERAKTEITSLTADLKGYLDVRNPSKDIIEVANEVQSLYFDIKRTIPLLNGLADVKDSVDAARNQIDNVGAWITDLFGRLGASHGEGRLDTVASSSFNPNYKTQTFYSNVYKVEERLRYVDFSKITDTPAGMLYNTFTTGDGILNNWYQGHLLRNVTLRSVYSKMLEAKNTLSLEWINNVVSESTTTIENFKDIEEVSSLRDDVVKSQLPTLKTDQKEVSLKINTFKLEQYIKSENTSWITATKDKLEAIISSITTTEGLTDLITKAREVIAKIK